MDLKQQKLYQKMDTLLKEREAIYQKREQELKKYQEELKGLEKELSQKKRELEQYEESISLELEHLLQEKLDLQSMNNERLKLEGEKELLAREQSRERLGITDMSVSLQEEDRTMREEVEEQPEEEVEEQPEEEAGLQTREEVIQEDGIDRMDGMDRIQKFVQEAETIFPEGKALDITPEMYCMSIGDKELRILMDKDDPPIAMILAKREKNRALLKGISQVNRIQADWEFTYQDNCLRCVMPFTEAIPAQVVLQKCAEAMSQYFK